MPPDSNTQSLNPPTKYPFQHRERKIDTAKALQLRLQGLSYQDIADHFNVTRSAAYQKLNNYFTNLPDLQDLNKSNVLEGLWKAASTKMLVESLNPNKVKKASSRDLMTSAAIAFDKYRLEAGKSTENIASIHAAIEAMSNKSPVQSNNPDNKAVACVDDDL